MLYLAEVQKGKGGLLSSGKTELRLLACQRSNDNWTTVANEETISADEASAMNPGALVLVELTSSKQVQKIEEASRKLASTLNTLSRLLEKSKSQEDEIEQWKQSLTYQSQELNRREMELEARTEQLQQLEEDFEQLEQQRQEIDGSKEENARLKEEVERSRQELESAWAQLRGEMNRLEEQQADLQGKPALDAEQTQKIQALLGHLTSTSTPTDAIRDHLNAGFEAINAFQSLLDGQWQLLEEKTGEAESLRQQASQHSQDISAGWQTWQQAQQALEAAISDLTSLQQRQTAQQDQEKLLVHQLDNYESIYQQLYQLADVSDQVVIGQKIDVEGLEKMPLEELQSVVQELQREFDKTAKLISMQEEELNERKQLIADLRTQIEGASEYDRMRLEGELTEEEESYRILNEPLIGQRQTLLEREAILKQNQGILAKRLGQPVAEGGERQIDLEPALLKITEYRKQQNETLQTIRTTLAEIQADIQTHQDQVNQKTKEQETLHSDLKQQEAALNTQWQAVGEVLGCVNVYNEMLQPTQDRLNDMRQRLEAIAGTLAQFQESGDSQMVAVSELNQIMQTLIGS